MSEPIIPCPWCGGVGLEMVQLDREDREGVPMAARCECGVQAPWQYIPTNIAKQESITRDMLIHTWNERKVK